MAKNRLEVFYDYLCPYCYRGVRELMELLPSYPNIEAVWRPCEAHPRPEYAQQHSDLAVQAEACVAAQGGDVEKFNGLVFDAHFEQGKRIDDAAYLAELAGACGAAAESVRTALENGRYAQVPLDNNTLVWETLGFEAVPSYRIGGELLGSAGGVLVPREKLRALLEKYN